MYPVTVYCSQSDAADLIAACIPELPAAAKEATVADLKKADIQFEFSTDPASVYAETVKKWLKTFYRRFFTQQFKRSALPDGVKVGSVALSPRGAWVMPSDAEVWNIEL